MSEASKTPRTDTAWKAVWEEKAKFPNSDPAHGMLDFAVELETELEAARRDAQRYRQVRLMLMEFRLSKYLASLPQSPITFDVFDAAIDAALRPSS